MLLHFTELVVRSGTFLLFVLGLTQKDAFACGSMVLFISVCSFFTLQGEKRTYREQKICVLA
jgi:hypothetical protein